MRSYQLQTKTSGSFRTGNARMPDRSSNVTAVSHRRWHAPPPTRNKARPAPSAVLRAASWSGRCPMVGRYAPLGFQNLSSRATRYIHCRPSPSPTVNVYSTPACQGRARLDGSSRRPAPTPTRTHKHARTHTHAHPRTRAQARARDREGEESVRASIRTGVIQQRSRTWCQRAPGSACCCGCCCCRHRRHRRRRCCCCC